MFKKHRLGIRLTFKISMYILGFKELLSTAMLFN